MEILEYEENKDKGGNSVTILVKTDYIPSVNNIYEIGRGGRRLVKSKAARNFESLIYGQLRKMDFEKIAPWLRPKLNYCLDFNFVIKQSFYKRDCSNMIKLAEDCVFRHLKLNDSRVVEGHQYKSFPQIVTGKQN